LDIGNALHKDQPLRCNIGQRDREKVLSEYINRYGKENANLEINVL